MDPISGFDIRLVFTLPPRDSTLQYKRCVHFWNNFPCITSLANSYFFVALNKYILNYAALLNDKYRCPSGQFPLFVNEETSLTIVNETTSFLNGRFKNDRFQNDHLKKLFKNDRFVFDFSSSFS